MPLPTWFGRTKGQSGAPGLRKVAEGLGLKRVANLGGFMVFDGKTKPRPHGGVDVLPESPRAAGRRASSRDSLARNPPSRTWRRSFERLSSLPIGLCSALQTI